MTPPWRVEGPSGLEMLTRQSYEENAERLRRLRIFAFRAGENAIPQSDIQSFVSGMKFTATASLI